MDWLKEQFAKSTIISGILALGIWGAIISLSIASKEVPDILIYGGTSVIGFFFGAKIGEVQSGLRKFYPAHRDGKDSNNGRH